MLLLTSSIYAQETSKKETHFGINLGTNIATFKNEIGSKDKDLKLGFVFGVYFEKQLNEKWAFKTNLNYVSKRNSKENEMLEVGGSGNVIGTFTQVISHHYINVPLLFKYNLGSKSFFINAGPNLNYQLNYTIKNTGDFNGNETTKDGQFNMGLSFGLGKKFTLNDKNDLIIELRDDYDLFTKGNAVKTNAINLIFTWSFSLNEKK